MRLLTASYILSPSEISGWEAKRWISNAEWLKKRIGFIRKLGRKTTRQRQIIDLLDDEWLRQWDWQATAPRSGNRWKKRVAGTGCRAEKGGSGTISGQKNRRSWPNCSWLPDWWLTRDWLIQKRVSWILTLKNYWPRWNGYAGGSETSVWPCILQGFSDMTLPRCKTSLHLAASVADWNYEGIFCLSPESAEPKWLWHHRALLIWFGDSLPRSYPRQSNS